MSRLSGAPFCRARSSCLLFSWTTRDRLDRLVARRRQRGRRLGGAAHDARAPQPGDDDDDATRLLSLSLAVGCFLACYASKPLRLWLASSRNRLRVARAPPLGLPARERKRPSTRGGCGFASMRLLGCHRHAKENPRSTSRSIATTTTASVDPLGAFRGSAVGGRCLASPHLPPPPPLGRTVVVGWGCRSFRRARFLASWVGRHRAFCRAAVWGLVAPFRFGSDLGSVADSSTGSSPR